MAHKYFRKMQEVAMGFAKEGKKEHPVKKVYQGPKVIDEKTEESKKVSQQPKIISLSETKGEEWKF